MVAPADTALAPLPVSEKELYAKAGLVHSKTPDMLGDTLVSFKSFLAAATASGVVCEVRWACVGVVCCHGASSTMHCLLSGWFAFISLSLLLLLLLFVVSLHS